MPAGSEQALTQLSPTSAFVESELSWVGNRFVAYHAALLPHPTQPGELDDNPFQRRTAFYAELASNGFLPQRMLPDESYTPGVVVQPTAGGFYMIEGLEQTTTFYPLPENDLPGYHFFVSLVSPSGSYSATFEAALPQIFSAESGTLSVPIASAQEGDECPLPLAWAKGRERLACLADVAQHGEIRIFDLDTESELLDMFTLGAFCPDDVSEVDSASCTSQQDGYGYASAQARGAARAFSDSGRWLAFAATHPGKSFLYTVDLEQRPHQLASHFYYQEAEGPQPTTRLAFSPDERLLLFQHGSALDLRQIASSSESYRLTQGLADDGPCTDDFPSAPAGYCGNTEHSAAFRWAGDATAFALRTPDTVSVVDVTGDPPTVQRSLAAPDCGGNCSNRFAFQP
jgi:hypothetical protein